MNVKIYFLNIDFKYYKIFRFISQLTDFCFFKYQNFITLRINFIFKNVNILFYFFTKNKQKFVIRRKIQNTTSKFDKL